MIFTISPATPEQNEMQETKKTARKAKVFAVMLQNKDTLQDTIYCALSAGGALLVSAAQLALSLESDSGFCCCCSSLTAGLDFLGDLGGRTTLTRISAIMRK